MTNQNMDPLNNENLIEIAKSIKYWHRLAEQRLGFTSKMIDNLKTKYETDQDRGYQALLFWKQKNKKLKVEEQVVQLENHLQARGEEKAVEQLQEIVHRKPVGHRELLTDMHLRFIGATVNDWKLVAEKLELPNDVIKKLGSKFFGKKLIPYNMLITWFNSYSPSSTEQKVDTLADALLAAGETVLVDDIRERQRIWLGCV